MMSKMMTFASGDGNHLNESVENLESRFPGKKIILVGACLGAMSTIDYLSTEEANRPSIGIDMLFKICFLLQYHVHSF